MGLVFDIFRGILHIQPFIIKRTYTKQDRILFHSLPDVRPQLQLLAYQMCDALRGSDHRPVAAFFNLSVNREVRSEIQIYHTTIG